MSADAPTATQARRARSRSSAAAAASVAVADAVAAAGPPRGAVCRSAAGPIRQRSRRYPHHWLALGQVGRFLPPRQAEGCRDVVFIGTCVRPRVCAHCASTGDTCACCRGVVRIVPRRRRSSAVGRRAAVRGHGFRLVGAHEVAPEILMPKGRRRRQPSDARRADIARGLALLRAIGPFDVGQAAVVADNHVLAVEAAEGTDRMLARVAELRGDGRIRVAGRQRRAGQGAEAGQDRRIDLPSIGPRTVEAARARARRHRGRGRRAIIAEPPRSRRRPTRPAVRRRHRGREPRDDRRARPAEPLTIFLVAAEESGDGSARH